MNQSTQPTLSVTFGKTTYDFYEYADGDTFIGRCFKKTKGVTNYRREMGNKVYGYRFNSMKRLEEYRQEMLNRFKSWQDSIEARAAKKKEAQNAGKVKLTEEWYMVYNGFKKQGSNKIYGKGRRSGNYKDGDLCFHCANYDGVPTEVHQIEGVRIYNGTDVMTDYFETDTMRVSKTLNPMLHQMLSVFVQKD